MVCILWNLAAWTSAQYYEAVLDNLMLQEAHVQLTDLNCHMLRIQAILVLKQQVPFWEYSWASSVGVLPGMAFFIYLGSLAHNLLDISSSQLGLNSTAAVVTIVLSGIMITLVAALTGALVDLQAAIHSMTCTSARLQTGCTLARARLLASRAIRPQCFMQACPVHFVGPEKLPRLS